MEPLLIFPDPPPAPLGQALDLAGYPWKAANSAEAATRFEPEDGWAGAIICADAARCASGTCPWNRSCC